jgi:hypothetical protein
MGKRVIWIDRLRITRAVWTLNVLVQDLPAKTRKAIRNELRVNLWAAANEVGAAQAVRRIGNLRRLATDYLEAEYGQSPRPRWVSAMFWMMAVHAMLLGLGFVGLDAFITGVEAANTHPSGTYTWDKLQLLGFGADVTFDDQGFSGYSITFSAWGLLYLLAALVVGGRLWRLPAAWRRARRRKQLVVDAP